MSDSLGDFRDPTPIEAGLAGYVGRLEAALRVIELEVYGRPEPFCRNIAAKVIEVLGHPEANQAMSENAQPTHGVKIGRGTVTLWKDEPITSREMAAECAAVIEEWTGERGEIVKVYASISIGGDHE